MAARFYLPYKWRPKGGGKDGRCAPLEIATRLPLSHRHDGDAALIFASREFPTPRVASRSDTTALPGGCDEPFQSQGP